MNIDIETLKDTFKYGYDTYLESRLKANMIEDMYHNRQYTDDQLTTLLNRQQPAETFNVIKLFARLLLGYYYTVINTTLAKPVQQSDIVTANLLSDVIAYVDRTNDFNSESYKIKLDGFLSGLFVTHIDVIPEVDFNGNTKKDEFGRLIYKIIKKHIHSSSIVLDPLSTADDYSDSRFIHKHKWIPKEEIIEKFGKAKVEKLDAYTNFLDIEEAEFEFKYNEKFQGVYKQYDNFLVVHTIMKDNKGDTWSIYWSDDYILDKKKITYKEVKNPYRVVKLSDSNRAEYYGIFEEVYQSQHAINQAILQIQLMVNSNKVLVADGAVENIDEFRKAYNRVNAIVQVNNLGGIRVENMTNEIQQQYIIIDRAFDRIKRVLGVNDSFLGMAFASDSGRKVKLQQNQTIMSLRYIDNKLELLYKKLGWDTVNLIKQYFRASQILRIVDETTGDRWVELNKPLIHPVTGKPFYDEELDPETGEPMKDEYGNIILTPLNHPETDIQFTDVDLEISAVAYNDEDEKNQLMLETMLSGNIGQALMTVNPSGYMKAASLSIKSMKTKYSKDISDILEQTAMMLQPQPEQQENLGMGGQLAGQSANSQQLKLPQNTNEGV